GQSTINHIEVASFLGAPFVLIELDVIAIFALAENAGIEQLFPMASAVLQDFFRVALVEHTVERVNPGFTFHPVIGHVTRWWPSPSGLGFGSGARSHSHAHG